MCVQCVAYSKSSTQPSLSLVCRDRGVGICLTVSGKNHTLVNCKHPTLPFLGLYVQFFGSLQKSTLMIPFRRRWGPPHSIPARGGGWAASGKNNPKLISDRTSRNLSDQVTRHGEETYPCLNVKGSRNKYI